MYLYHFYQTDHHDSLPYRINPLDFNRVHTQCFSKLFLTSASLPMPQPAVILMTKTEK